MTEQNIASRAQRETQGIPDRVRRAVDARDRQTCRVCGRFLGSMRALHHIVYGGNVIGMGGARRHHPDEIITVCWMWPGNCHDLVHSDKATWQPLLIQATRASGVTAFQLQRWGKRRGARP